MVGEHAKGDDLVEREGFVSGIGRRWRWIAAGTLAGLFASAAIVALIPPRYVAVAEALLAGPDQGGRASETDTLAVADLAEAAIAKLGPAADAELGSAGGSDHGALEAFLARLSMTPSPRSGAIEIAFVARDPGLAALGANTVAELVVRSRNEARANAVEARRTWLAHKIEDGKARVADADAKVEASRVQSGLLSGGDGRPPGSDETADLDAKLSAARAAETAAADRAEALRRLEREGRLAETPPAAAGDSMRRLLDQRAALKGEIAEASRTLLPLHPRMKELAAELAGLDGQIREAADKTARDSEADARRAGDEAAAIAAKLAEQPKPSAPPLDAGAASLNTLEAEAQAARHEMAAFQQMAREEEARAATERGEARILSRAEPPRAPVYPKVAPILVEGTGAGLILSTLAAAFAAAAIRGRRPGPVGAPVASAPQEAGRTVAATASAPPVVEPSPAAAWIGDLDSPGALVATLDRMKPKGPVVVLVAGDRTGRALAVALATARRFAADRAAVFVDLGDTQDWLSDILYREGPAEPDRLGLADLIAGRAAFGDVIGRDLSSSLDVVLPGQGGLDGDLDEALTAFSTAYAAVVLHASDWRSPWARAAAAFADAVVVAAPAARAKAALDAAEAQLGDACPTFLAFGVRAAQTAPEAVD